MTGETMADVLPTLPADLRPAARELYTKAADVTPDAEDTLTVAYRILREAKGEPERLDSGCDLLSGSVAAQISAARDDIGSAGARFAGSWSGGGADGFAAYLPKLTGAIGAMEDSATRTAAAVRSFRRAMAELWDRIVERTWHAGAEIVAAVAQVGSRNAAPAVLGIVDRFAGFVGGIADALLELADGKHHAAEALEEARRLPDDVAVGADGPRLPVPADVPAEPGDDATGWRPSGGGELRVDRQAMTTMIRALRDSGAYWDVAARQQDEAGRTYLTPRAFGLGIGFYGDVQEVLGRDRALYLDSNARMDSVAEALTHVDRLYESVDEDARAVFNDRLDND